MISIKQIKINNLNLSPQLAHILSRIREGSAIPSDYEELRNMINADESGNLLEQLNAYYQAQAVLPDTTYNKSYWQDLLSEILQVDKSAIVEKVNDPLPNQASLVPPSSRPAHRLHFLRRWGWAAAAAVLLIVYFIFQPGPKPKPELATLDSRDSTASSAPILPGGNKAVLQLSDGRVITLDSASSGNLASEGNMKVLKLDNGTVAYESAGKPAKEVLYNSIHTPRGGQYKLILPDGSRVWLNASSSIKYPVSFTAAERKVEISGEAYFEVTHDAAKPFLVDIMNSISGGSSQVQVLGTHFNVMAYDDEPALQTTLLEGAVRVIYRKHNEPISSMQINPGQQAVLDNKGRFTLLDHINTEEIVAWKNGYFQFDKADIKTVMRQLARWYDIEVIYEGKLRDRAFVGQIRRSEPLANVLAILEQSHVHFRVEGRKIIVYS